MNEAETTETTLGDLIVALTEETSPVISDKGTTYTIVSYMLTDLFLKRHVAFKKRLGRGPIAQARAARKDLYE